MEAEDIVSSAAWRQRAATSVTSEALCSSSDATTFKNLMNRLRRLSRPSVRRLYFTYEKTSTSVTCDAEKFQTAKMSLECRVEGRRANEKIITRLQASPNGFWCLRAHSWHMQQRRQLFISFNFSSASQPLVHVYRRQESERRVQDGESMRIPKINRCSEMCYIASLRWRSRSQLIKPWQFCLHATKVFHPLATQNRTIFRSAPRSPQN